MKCIAFHNETTIWMDEGRAMHIVSLDFSKAFDTVFHNNLVGKPSRCRLNEWTVRWTENSVSCESTPGEVSHSELPSVRQGAPETAPKGD